MKEEYTITKALIKHFENSTGLQYVPQDEVGRVCFATQNQDLRDEFKVVFSLQDLKHYLSVEKQNFSPDSNFFWKMVKLGKTGQ